MPYPHGLFFLPLFPLGNYVFLPALTQVLVVLGVLLGKPMLRVS